MRSLLERTLDELAKDLHWSRRVVVINVYHNYKKQGNPRWTYADTGRDLDLSKAFVSEAAKLANILTEHPDIMHLSRRKALMQMRRK